ncbi:MAG TPA: hypothetical protein GX707_19390 [Epulopiscium sp.]|nr:hypothetical protein [Candidatus Epulonipiscium sp.]
MNQLKSQLEQVILKHFAKSSVHGLNNSAISSKKVENVKVLHNIKDEKVWFIYDATLFGSAKDGMVFTNRGIYWREVLESPQKLDYIEMIESTANQGLKANVIFILDKAGEIEIKEAYYNFIAELRLEIVKSSIIYETYYRSGLQGVEQSLIRLFEKGKYHQIIKWLNKYEGLFLLPKHKSVKTREISFEVFMKEQMFSRAQEELDILKERNPVYYRKAAPLLEVAIKQDRYSNLETERTNAIEILRRTMEESKKQTLEKHLHKLNLLLESEKFLEAEQTVEQIYKIEPLYSLEREKILLTISSNNLKQAKEKILQLEDPILRVELDGILKKTTKKLHEKIRNTVRNKQYDIFESHPDIWNYKDEYGMCALSYFALEADLVGILKALSHVDLLLMPANIFGHNFVDLIGFACDKNFGNKKENPLEILKKIKSKVDLKQIDDRINFFKTGQEGSFFSYKVSQEDKLSELNQKLISPDHFKQVLIEIENQTHNHVDKIIRHLFGGELEATPSYPIKDEFETSEAYKNRCRVFKKLYLGRDDFIVEYKRQNEPMVEGISQLLKDKKSCYVPSVSAMVEYKNTELETLKDLQSPEDSLKLLNIYFPIKKEVSIVEVGTYDADKEVFVMIIDGVIQELPMPLAIAKQYKKTFPEIEYVRRRVFKDGKVMVVTVPLYGNEAGF